MNRFCRKTPKARFTLVELLVVISIISILASMLLPALKSAMDSARKITCMNNLKQVHLAAMQYTDDYSGFLPPTTDGTQTFDRMLGRMYLTSDGEPFFQCPVDPRAGRISNYRTHVMARRSSISPAGISWSVGMPPVKLSMVKKPKEKVFMLPWITDNNKLGGGAFRYVDGPTNATVHGDYANYLFLQGNVEYVHHLMTDFDWWKIQS